MSAQRPLGATEQGGVGLTADSLGLRTTAAFGNSKLGLAGLTGVVASTVVLTVAAAHTRLLLPETVAYPQKVPGLAGPFANASINIRSGGLIAVMLVMFISYVVVVRTAEGLSPRAVLGCVAAINA